MMVHVSSDFMQLTELFKTLVTLAFGNSLSSIVLDMLGAKIELNKTRIKQWM